MAHVLVAVATHTALERSLRQRLVDWVEAAGHRAVVLPEPRDHPQDQASAVRAAVSGCDACLAVLDGVPLDPGLAWLVGYLRASRRSILGIRTDRRSDKTWVGLPPEVRSALNDVVVADTWDAPELQAKLAEFLGGVRVFAGALVRDDVPKILREEGRELRFRQVDESQYPLVLKRKIVETAQRLEESEWGVEQEEIADVLELLETLINLRKYDKESLRSIKEGKWRKRGGFQKGFLLDEEPAISSR